MALEKRKRPDIPGAFAGTAEEWNANHPVGTRVRVHFDSGNLKHYLETETRSEAWNLGHGEPVVMVKGKTGGYGLGFIKVLGVAK